MAQQGTGTIQPAVEIDYAGVDPAELRILIVDDSRFCRGVIRNALSVFHFMNTVEAVDAENALEIMNSNRIDMVLVDFEMPGIGGVELVRSIRWDESGDLNPEVPIIMISKHTETEVIIQARNAGIHEFVVKPVSPKDLYRRIVFTLLNPRPFIRVDSYRGPDRRWMKDEAGPGGIDRRGIPEVIDCR